MSKEICHPHSRNKLLTLKKQMPMNVSKQHRDDLLNKIQQIRTYIASAKQDQNTGNLLQYLDELTKDVKGKKYGLVFEQHREKIDETLETHTPVLTEQPDLFIDNGGQMNFLIEGDNLASLQLLEKTHRGKIDVIYIDPPYNTGKNEKDDFHYDDKFVDINDTFRHSKWLSFMEKRLCIAKNLLRRKGVIFISIDDNEQATLKLLCDDIFECIAVLPTIMNLKGNQDEFGFAGTHEYTLVYAKNKSKAIIGEFDLNEEEFENDWQHDEIGYYKQGATLKRTGQDAPREKRPWCFFPILINSENSVSTITDEEYSKIYDPNSKTFDDGYIELIRSIYTKKGFAFVLPITDDEYTSWRWGFKTVKKDRSEIIAKKTKTGYSLYKKQRPELSDLPTKKPKSIFYKAQYSSGNGTSQLKNIFGAKKFNNPKPIDLIYDFIKLSSTKSSTILDFFAGSGTTGHAVMKLNAEDGGHRKFILCTNNENNICRDVTYERLKTVITGKRKDGSNYNEKYDASLKYYKIDFVKIDDKMYYEYADELLLHIRELVELENGINFNGNAEIAIVLTDEEMEKFVKMENNTAKILYRGHNVLMTAEQEAFLQENGIKVNVIPDYYYNELNR